MSPMFSDGSTPPAMPENTIRSTLKWSSASWVVIAALMMLIPLRNSTTSCPCRVPTENSTPFTEWVDVSESSALSMESSGEKADTTAVRATLS